MTWQEVYFCGCMSPEERRKRNLPGYCPKHGDDRRELLKDDGPGDAKTADRFARALRALATGQEEKT